MEPELLAIRKPIAEAERLIELVVNSVNSQLTRKAYRHALRCFIAWLAEKPEPPTLCRALVYEYRTHLLESMSPSSINIALSAIRKLAKEAAYADLLSHKEADAITVVPNVPNRGRATGNWLSQEDMLRLLAQPDQSTHAGCRDFVLFTLLLGAGLRISECVALNRGQVRELNGRLVLADVLGKGKKLRTAPLPSWAWQTMAKWLLVAPGAPDGPLLRSYTPTGELNGRLTIDGAYWIVKQYAAKLDIRMAPHDLRRSFGRAAVRGGADVSQVQIALGHASLATTTRYLGTEIDWENLPCEKLGV